MQAVALIEAIHREHSLARSSARTSLEHALECGRLLLEAKGQLEHGEWLPWVAKHCAFSADTAQTYMRLAKSPKTERAQEMSIRDAMTLVRHEDDAEEMAAEAWSKLTPHERAEAMNSSRRQSKESGLRKKDDERRTIDLAKAWKWLVKAAKALAAYDPSLEEEAAMLAARVRQLG